MTRVLITGASTGIGAATALRLDASGMDVFAGVRAPGEGDEALAGGSPRLQQIALDVTDPASIAAAMDDVGALDALVNNAGIGVPGPLEAVPIDALREQLEVNVVAQVAVTQAALPLLRTSRLGGRVVFVGSIGGQLASQFAGPYHASKFAIEAITDVWRQELEPEELSVILIEPSTISTQIWEKAIGRLDAMLRGGDPRLGRYRERIESFKDSLRAADEHGQDPDAVASVIEKALTEKNPDTRYVVGASGRLATALRPLIPDRVADKLGEQTAKP